MWTNKTVTRKAFKESEKVKTRRFGSQKHHLDAFPHLYKRMFPSTQKKTR